MSVQGITGNVRTALATQVTSGGVSCLEYDEWDVPSGSIATVGLVEWEIDEQRDQSYGIRALTASVIVYQLVDGSIRDSLAYHEANVERAIDGLGASRTLGGAVAHSEVVEATPQIVFRNTGGQAMVTAAIKVRVMPFPNVGS